MAKLGLNKVMLIGNLGGEPEVRTIENGAKVANVNIATTETYTDKTGTRVDRTEWHRIVLWRGLADVAEKYLHKGSTIYVEGRLTTRSWDGEDGKKNYRTEIEALNMIMLDGPRTPGPGSVDSPAAQYGNAQEIKSSMQGANEPHFNDDLPF